MQNSLLFTLLMNNTRGLRATEAVVVDIFLWRKLMTVGNIQISTKKRTFKKRENISFCMTRQNRSWISSLKLKSKCIIWKYISLLIHLKCKITELLKLCKSLSELSVCMLRKEYSLVQKKQPRVKFIFKNVLVHKFSQENRTQVFIYDYLL